MSQQISLTAVAHHTAIPVPTLSMYANGHRSISARHRPLIAALLNLPPAAIVGYCTRTEVITMSTYEPGPEEPTDEEPTLTPELDTEGMGQGDSPDEGEDEPEDLDNG